MSFLIKAAFGLSVVAGAAHLPVTTVATAPTPAPTVEQRTATTPAKLAQLAPGTAKEAECFVARKKSVKRKASAYVRLVKVCE